MNKIKKYLSKNGPSKTSDIASYIKLSSPRTRAILNEMPDVSHDGSKCKLCICKRIG